MSEEKLTTVNASTITADPFIRYFIEDLLRSLRKQYIVDIVKPYTRMKIDFLGQVSFLSRQSLPDSP